MKCLTLEEGAFLVKLARKAVKEYLDKGMIISPPDNVSERLKEKRGVFVTIEKIEIDEKGVWQRKLRGCIGFPEPVYPLVEATIQAAVAASEDPRFPPLTLNELSRVVFEVSVLSPLELIKVEKPLEYLKVIKIGRDGLLVEKGIFKGLLLPQVPVEYEWDVETFLNYACMKAGLPPDAWLDPDTKIYRFTAQIFYELEPEGRIIERQLEISR